MVVWPWLLLVRLLRVRLSILWYFAGRPHTVVPYSTHIVC